ncbi:MAG: PilZ domain-containing protein [Smithella sp.]
MEERKREQRLQEEAIEVTVTIDADGTNFHKESVIYSNGEDISTSGIKIKSNIFLPVNTFLKMDIKLKYMQQKIDALGKVKWIKTIVENESYDVGVQFISIPHEAIAKLEKYVSWEQKV